MSIDPNNRELPVPQLDKLGLRENPFKNNSAQHYFYADQNRAKLLESTEHLVSFSTNFQVIIGASGVGKSHFLEALLHRTDNNWRSAKIMSAEQYDTLSLIQAILNAFSIQNDANADLLETLEIQLSQINQLGFKPVLFIDSDQVLSLDSLRFLIQLSQQRQDDDAYINIVLLSPPEIGELLQDPQLRDFRDIIHVSTLAPFDKEGVSGYLRHKMAVAGFDRESPFTPRIIDSIFSNSQGMPEKINFYANKFLVSSGKADNYIDKSLSSTQPVIDDIEASYNENEFQLNTPEQSEDVAPAFENQNDDFMNTFSDDDLSPHRSDKAGEQLSRLAEKFEEIEQMNDSSEDHDDGSEEQYNDSDTLDEIDYDDELSGGFKKYSIPLALFASLLLVIVVFNNVFDQTPQNNNVKDKEDIATLPLELPAEIASKEKLLTKPDATQSEVVQENIPTQLPNAVITENTTRLEIINTPELKATTDDVAVDNAAVKAEEANPSVNVKTDSVIDSSPTNTIISEPIPELLTVESTPIIGSKKNQYIVIKGKELEPDIRLIVSWAGNKKEFSAKQTPSQWQYIDKTTIKLYLNTGITAQQWHIVAKNAQNVSSRTISFDVVKPFMTQLVIKNIRPQPFLGSDQRQAITIEGLGFSKQTVIELRWDKNKKQFSAHLTPSQFEFVNNTQIKLFVATGKTPRKWKLSAINPSGKKYDSSFLVSNKKIPDTIIKDNTWLTQQIDAHYTIQLFASHDKKAVADFITKQALKETALVYTTQRQGQDWFALTYGNYISKQKAQKALSTLKPELTKTHWIRSFASIKEQLHLTSKNKDKPQIVKPTSIVKQGSIKQGSITSQTQGKSKDVAWIWTQNPNDYTVQLIALSAEAKIKNYINKYQLQSKAAYFKTMRDGKELYVLIYGNYSSKVQAQQESQRLKIKIIGSKPWVRAFSAIHGMLGTP